MRGWNQWCRWFQEEQEILKLRPRTPQNHYSISYWKREAGDTHSLLQIWISQQAFIWTIFISLKQLLLHIVSSFGTTCSPFHRSMTLLFFTAMSYICSKLVWTSLRFCFYSCFSSCTVYVCKFISNSRPGRIRSGCSTTWLQLWLSMYSFIGLQIYRVDQLIWRLALPVFGWTDICSDSKCLATTLN